MTNFSGQARALTVLTPIVRGQETALRLALDALGRRANSPFEGLGRTHFARFIVVDQLIYQGPPQARDLLDCGYLLFSAIVDRSGAGGSQDADLERYVRDLCAQQAALVDRIWSHCAGFPGPGDAASCVRYLLRHRIVTAAMFSGYPDATVEDVLRALERRRKLIRFAHETQDCSAADLLRRFRAEFGTVGGGDEARIEDIQTDGTA